MGINIDWDNLSFKLTPAKTMYLAKAKQDGEWKGEFKDYGDISLSPAAVVLNYGQGLFEGMKAQRTKDGKIVIFRPLENGKRMANGAERLCMTPFPPEKFVEVIKEFVKVNQDYVPPYKKGALYIRPCLWGTAENLGVAPSKEYTFVVYGSPVGPYFKEGFKPIKLEVSTQFHRAAPNGTGNVKAIGNYAGGILPAKLAKAKGYNEAVYLDAKYDKYIEEVGAANFFCVKGDNLFTPKSNSILPGITRKSLMKLAEEELKMEVKEKELSIDEVWEADEVFCVGTAAVISPIGLVSYKGKEKIFNNFEVGDKTQKLYDMLKAVQLQEMEDKHNWVVEVEL